MVEIQKALTVHLKNNRAVTSVLLLSTVSEQIRASAGGREVKEFSSTSFKIFGGFSVRPHFLATGRAGVEEI